VLQGSISRVSYATLHPLCYHEKNFGSSRGRLKINFLSLLKILLDLSSPAVYNQIIGHSSCN